MKDDKLNSEDSNEDQTQTSSCVRDQTVGVKYASNEFGTSSRLTRTPN